MLFQRHPGVWTPFANSSWTTSYPLRRFQARGRALKFFAVAESWGTPCMSESPPLCPAGSGSAITVPFLSRLRFERGECVPRTSEGLGPAGRSEPPAEGVRAGLDVEGSGTPGYSTPPPVGLPGSREHSARFS